MKVGCLECRREVVGAWGVVIFPDFSKGWCTLGCYRKWCEKKKQKELAERKYVPGFRYL